MDSIYYISCSLIVCLGLAQGCSSENAAKSKQSNIVEATLPDPSPELVTSIDQPQETTRVAPEIQEDFRMSADNEYAAVRDNQFFTTAIVDSLVPGELQSVFKLDRPVYAYAALHAPRQEKVQFQWFTQGGEELLPSTLLSTGVNTGPVGYRIFTFRTFRETGQYSVELTNSAGVKIGQADFTVIK